MRFKFQNFSIKRIAPVAGVLVPALLFAGCAGPSLSSRSFPALTWNKDQGPTTGSIERRGITTGPNRYTPQRYTNRTAPARPLPQANARPQYRLPRRTRENLPDPQYRAGARIADNNPATFDPLPRYAEPDRNRNRYQWNGDPQRRLIDNSRNRRTVAAPRMPARPGNIGAYGGNRSVRVAPGDTLYAIARRHGVTTRDMMAANRMSRTDIRVGQVLVLPRIAR